MSDIVFFDEWLDFLAKAHRKQSEEIESLKTTELKETYHWGRKKAKIGKKVGKKVGKKIGKKLGKKLKKLVKKQL